ncbi:paraquat-inducible protein A [Mucilaginibacter auburnensis]|uniref:Paraquat-inducible protein A n=1 Tax=Mucilaginibacter auburnensis TaxID=1457233 RepID=A0A2H9VN02_9SPHI|nr:paraquat-inducible protein A [Mucilaginibacter auburnensis]PJJ79693.1 paraquat-inducible protein A [Mucilaginibacter auburnensis]
MPSILTNKTTNRSFFWAKAALIVGMCVLVGVEAYFGYRLKQLSAQQEVVKADYSEINNIAYGLLSVEQWQDEVASIVNKQIRNLKFTSKQKRLMQEEVEEVLNALIDKAEAMVDKKPKSLIGKIRKFAIKTFVKTDKIRAQVPSLARKIIAKADNPNQKAKLSDLVMDEFQDLKQSKTVDSTLKANHKLFNTMYRKYGVSSTPQLNSKLNQLLGYLKTEMYRDCFVMLACILVVLSLWWILRKETQLHTTLFMLSLVCAFVLLGVGLSASMIEVDCRIKTLDFTLLGEHVIFTDQVLFYESKSILGVVKVLIEQSGAESIAVGVLILCFSVIFPVMKLSSTGIHLLGKKSIAESKFIKYFAFQSGKWSMADVIVIAILMTYIGLNGLLESQLAGLNVSSKDLTIITTNNTALQPGYIIFISFVLFGLILSTILKNITPHHAH